MGGRKSIKEKLRDFKSRVGKEISFKKFILFGSRAEGKTGRDRDVDLLIVSSVFDKLDFFQRGAKMYDYWDLDYPVDFLCYTPDEFNRLKKRATIVREAVENGIEIN